MNEVLVKKLYSLVRYLRQVIVSWELPDSSYGYNYYIFDDPNFEWFFFKCCADEAFFENQMRTVLQYCEAVYEDINYQREWMSWDTKNGLPFIKKKDMKYLETPIEEVTEKIRNLNVPDDLYET